jgi:hypothetical protein
MKGFDGVDPENLRFRRQRKAGTCSIQKLDPEILRFRGRWSLRNFNFFAP